MWNSRLLKGVTTGLLFLACGWLVLISLQLQFSVASGLILMGLALYFPLRRQEEKWDLFWDTLGWLAAVLFAVVATKYVRIPVQTYLAGLEVLQPYHQSLRSMPLGLALLLNLLLIDFFYYWGHRLVHHRWFWSQHAWHHSPQYLTWLSGSRTTFVNHLLLIATPTVLVNLINPMPKVQGALLGFMAFLRLVDHLHHTNLALPWTRQVEAVLITPRVHFVHHSKDLRHSNSNFGFIFPFCDRIFGTYTDPDTLGSQDYPLGINYENSNWRLLWGLPPRPPQSSPEVSQNQAESV